MMILVTATILVLPVMLVLMYSRRRHSYWARRGVPVAPDCWPIFGHTYKFFSNTEQSWEFLDRIYRRHRGSTFCGAYDIFSPELIVGDPDLVNNILIKDFEHFVDRLNSKSCGGQMDEIFEDMLNNATGAHWKGIRSVLSPSFTSGRMKVMLPLVAKKVNDLIQSLHERIKMHSAIEVRKRFENYSLEVISSCAFGMETNVQEDKNSEFNTQAAKILNTDLCRIIEGLMFQLFSNSCKCQEKDLEPKEILFFKDVVMESLKRRKAGLNRGDFLDLMMEARKDQLDPYSTTPKYPLKDNAIVAQSVLFLLAGFDTTASTLSFTTFLLAKYPEMQHRLRGEMIDVVERDGGELTYQGIMEAKFLDAVISETLRMYGPITATDRQCTKDYNLPGTEIIIPKDMVVIVPIYSIHHDKRFWPEPKKFCPERFLPENKVHIKSGTYLPFGTGPRSCIGMRFGLMTTKLAIAKIVLEFNLSCVPGQEEIRLSQMPGNIRPADDLSVVFTPRK